MTSMKQKNIDLKIVEKRQKKGKIAILFWICLFISAHYTVLTGISTTLLEYMFLTDEFRK